MPARYERRVAKVPRRCGLCSNAIQPGDAYTMRSAINHRGEWSTFAKCSRCAPIPKEGNGR